MPDRDTTNWISEFGLDNRLPPEFLRNPADLFSESEFHPNAHILARAWKDLKLDGVLCSQKIPLIYFKTTKKRDFSLEERRATHTRFWNHGVAPLLAMISRERIRVYSSSALPTKNPELVDSNHRLVTSFERTLDSVTAIQEFIRSTEIGSFFSERDVSNSFKSADRIDGHLLENLKSIRSLLSENGLPLDTVHAILGRTIFLSYLFDRGIIGSQYLQNANLPQDCKTVRDLLRASDPAKNRNRLYRLFSVLKRHFNGDLFARDLSSEKESLSDIHMRLLTNFFSADDMESGQTSFWAYDFRFIPIELISAVYQEFLGKDSRVIKSAYYTPRFVAEILLDVALEDESVNWKQFPNMKFLDPACGSGIFLVCLFNRLATIWKHQHPTARYPSQVQALRNILTDQLYGVESDPNACGIAAFSLYLAFLDQLEPRDIQKLISHAQKKGDDKVLPLLIHRNGNRPNGNNIIPMDFFDDELPLKEKAFDVIVGNPPWQSLKGPEQKPEVWCRERGLPIANKQLAQCFVWKAPTHLKPNGTVTFLLPYSILFNHRPKSLKTQRAWLSRYAVDRIFNLADARRLIFDEAIRPVIIARFRNESPQEMIDEIEYIVPKADDSLRRARVLSIWPSDVHTIPLRRILGSLDNDNVPLDWKTAMWGTRRDQLLIERLSMYPRLESEIKKRSWIIGQGCQPHSQSDDQNIAQRVSWPRNFRFIRPQDIRYGLVLTQEETLPIPSKLRILRRNPSHRIYRAPHVLISKGFTKVAYADFDTLFQHSIQAISGTESDRDDLMFLTALLASDLARYYAFHTSSNWGNERTEVHVKEMLRIPFPSPLDTPDPSIAEKKRKQIVGIIQSLSVKYSMRGGTSQHEFKLTPSDVVDSRGLAVEQARDKLQKLILEYMGVDKSAAFLINDTVNLWIPSIMPAEGTSRIPALDIPTNKDCGIATEILCKEFNKWVLENSWCVNGEVTLSRKVGFGVISLHRVGVGRQDKQVKVFDSHSKLDEVLGRIQDVIGHSNRSIHYQRDLKVFDGDYLHILKPLRKRFWCASSALNDADEIAAEIIRPE